MNLFNGIQVIKCSISRMLNNHRIGPEAEEDVKLLSAICDEVHVLCACNGREYWYYCPDKMENVCVAKYLLERNGVVPTFRMSRYLAGWGKRRPAFRLSRSYLLRHPEQNNFVKQIEERNYSSIEDANLQQQILNLRNQIRQK